MFIRKKYWDQGKSHFNQRHSKYSNETIKLFMLMTRLPKLGFTPFTKDRFRIQSDLGDLEMRSEIDTI